MWEEGGESEVTGWSLGAVTVNGDITNRTSEMGAVRQLRARGHNLTLAVDEPGLSEGPSFLRRGSQGSE